MARFHYRMQSILDIKMKMETQAKQEYAMIKAELDKEEKKLYQLQDRKKGYEREAVKLLKGNLKLLEIAENKEAILRMEEYIIVQSQQVELAEQKLEEARQRLTEVMKERKTHESLKEKAFEQFLQEENRQESKQVDELVSYVYGQKRQVN